jgi:hypothetical protein
MSGLPDFGLLLARLLDYRKLDVDELSVLSGIPGAELRAVLVGASPDPSLFERLAPALGLHTADLMVMAGAPVPDKLAPRERRAGRLVPVLAGYAMSMPRQSRRRLIAFTRSLARHDLAVPVPVPKSYEQYPPSFGALLLRMLGNRNLDWGSTAQLLYLLRGLVLSGSTVGMVGHGRKEVDASLLAGFAAVLGIPAGELAALGGIDLRSDILPLDPAAGDIAELIWHTRQLTADQVEQARSEARSLQEG